MPNLNRRDFLKAASMAFITPLIQWNSPEAKPIDEPLWWGRVTEPSIWAYANPKPGARKVRLLPRDTVSPLLDSISTEGLMATIRSGT